MKCSYPNTPLTIDDATMPICFSTVASAQLVLVATVAHLVIVTSYILHILHKK